MGATRHRQGGQPLQQLAGLGGDRETIFRWEDQENIRIFCGQIHPRKLQSHDFSGADGHDEGSSKHPMDSAVDYAAESSAFRELCTGKI